MVNFLNSCFFLHKTNRGNFTVKDALQPILILGSDYRVIKQGADMMLDVPGVIYKTSNLITGIIIIIIMMLYSPE